jgi:hypothetical protein
MLYSQWPGIIMKPNAIALTFATRPETLGKTSFEFFTILRGSSKQTFTALQNIGKLGSNLPLAAGCSKVRYLPELTTGPQ